MIIKGKKVLKSTLLTYFYEFLVLFASIYIAFELEEWGEDQDNIHREEAYLASLHQDLLKDSNQLKRRVAEYDEKIQNANKVLILLDSSYEEKRHQILDVFESHLQYHFDYNPVNSTLETLRSSGDFKLIQNLHLKILLSELDKSYNITLAQGNIFNNYIEGIQWSGFFINHFDTKNMVILEDRPFLMVLFKNKTRHYITLIESYYFQLQGTLKKTEEVKLLLESELKERKMGFDGDFDPENHPSKLEAIEDSLVLEIDDFLDDLESDSTLEDLQVL